MPLPRGWLSGMVGAYCVLILSGCGAPEKESAATPQPTLTPAELLEQAGQRLAQTSSVHFVLAVEGETFIDPVAKMRLLGADGDLQRPDRVRAIFQIEVTGRAISLQLVSIGEEAWMTNLLTGDWAIAPPEFGYRPTILFSPVYGIGQMMATAQHIERLQDETISGRSAHHLRAATVRAFVRPLTYNTIKGSPVTVEFWIDRETLDLLRTRISEPRGANRTDPAVWTIDFSHHNDAVSIEPPV